LQIVTPQYHEVDQTLFVTKVGHEITRKDAHDIQDNINSNNTKVQVTKLFVIKGNNANANANSRKSLKVVFSTNAMADIVVNEGFYIFGLFISPDKISKEKTTKLWQCYRCFQFNHKTNKCNAKEASCSICAGAHHFKECKDDINVKCINCEGKHLAIFLGCPKRKEYAKLLEDNKNKRDSAKAVIAPNDTAKPNINTYLNAPAHNTNAWVNNVNNGEFPLLPNVTQPALSNSHDEPKNNTHDHHGHSKSTPQPQLNSFVTPKHVTTDNNNKNNNYNDSNLFKTHAWEIKLSIVKTYAEMKAQGDPEIFLEVMNNFLGNHGLSPIKSFSNNTSPSGLIIPTSPSDNNFHKSTTPLLSPLPSISPIASNHNISQSNDISQKIESLLCVSKSYKNKEALNSSAPGRLENDNGASPALPLPSSTTPPMALTVEALMDSYEVNTDNFEEVIGSITPNLPSPPKKLNEQSVKPKVQKVHNIVKALLDQSETPTTNIAHNADYDSESADSNVSVDIGVPSYSSNPSATTIMSTLQLSPSGDSMNSQVSNGHNYALRNTAKRQNNEERVTFSLLSQPLSLHDSSKT